MKSAKNSRKSQRGRKTTSLKMKKKSICSFIWTHDISISKINIQENKMCLLHIRIDYTITHEITALMFNIIHGTIKKLKNIFLQLVSMLFYFLYFRYSAWLKDHSTLCSCNTLKDSTGKQAKLTYIEALATFSSDKVSQSSLNRWYTVLIRLCIDSVVSIYTLGNVLVRQFHLS